MRGAFCVHFYKDIKQQLSRWKLPAVDGPSLIPAVFAKPRASCIGSINVESSASPLELFARFDTSQPWR
jgi:hypothetical protein